MSDSKLVWSDEHGDLRKQKAKGSNESVQEENITLHLRLLTSGKGRRMIEISNLPDNKKWCQQLAKEFKKKIGVGGAFKNNFIEVHSDNWDRVSQVLDARKIKWKKTGG
jgi:translation initiation factor 1